VSYRALWGRGLGGAPLRGNKIVRLIYLDEAGISNPAHEPFLVVAGVIVDADRKWKELETYFRNLATDILTDVGLDPYRFVFHAKDIWHGSRVFDRRKWPLKTRLKLLTQLSQVPRLFDLPIIAGAVNRKSASDQLLKMNPEIPARTIRGSIHSQAFLIAIQCTELWMEKNTKDEVAMLIAEDNPEIKAFIQRFHEGYTNPELDNEDAFKSNYIVDAVHFAKKQNSLLLQIADHCSFFIKRKLMKDAHVEPFYRAIAPQINWNFRETKGYAITVHPSEITATDAA